MPEVKTAARPSTAGPVAPREESHDAPQQAPTEFQQFVASSVGRVLPIFGASLFDRVPSTFAPLDRAPVTADYLIGPGDEILLRAWGQVSLDLDLTVDRVGAVYIPEVGNVSVTGLRYQQLPGFLQSRLARVYRNFDMTVNMGQLRSVEIFVVGQVRRPGTYTVSSLSTLVNALFASGGPSAQGSMRHIQLKREGQAITEFDLYDLLLKGDKSKDRRLMPGDVVYVPPAGPQIAVAGSVKNPAVYELSDERTAGQALELAGGVSAVADFQRATLERIRERSALETKDIALDPAGLATEIQDGDIMRVLPVTPRFANAVTLRGNVANPGRLPWRDGMRLRDLVPNKESLITRDYWTKRNVLGFAPQEESVPPAPGVEARRSLPRTNIEALVPDINWSYAVIERQSPLNLTTELIPFNPGKLILEGDESQNLPLRAGDVVTFFSQADIKVAAAQQTRLVRLEGEVAASGVYVARPGETLGQLLERAGGLTKQAYLFGSEFLRESTRVDQQRRLDQFTRDMETSLEQGASNRYAGVSTQDEATALANRVDTQRRVLERLRTLKATGRIVLNLEPGSADLAKLMELPLEDGDRFTVPMRPATVNVLGAVYNQNAVVYESRLRVRDYLRYAGGPTRDADMARAFIIRADGSVIPNSGWSPFAKGFEDMRLNAGDSIVVPEALFRSSVLRGLRDWTQVFAQLALGAAAINVLR